jgi:hypothetical protein
MEGVRPRSVDQAFEIQCDDIGVRLAGAPRSESRLKLIWERIDTVFAYKQDCLTTDQIRLIFGNGVDSIWVEVCEDDVGFDALLAKMGRRLPGFPDVNDWWDKVALPAFETRWTELYRRNASRARS